MEWHNIEKEGYPKDSNDLYALIVDFYSKPITFNQLCSFSANLYEFNIDDFGYLKDCINKRGFYYYYDGDFIAVNNVIAWAKVESYKEEK
jgi:hypothetical protein